MINLHQKYNHYLGSTRTHDLTNERIMGYGWTDNGTDLDGYYVLTENHTLYYDLKDQFIRKELR